MNITISAEERKSFEQFYNKRLLEAGGGRTFAEDAQIVRDLLRAVREEGLTPTADGGVSFVRPGAVDWHAPGAVEATQAALAGNTPNASAGTTGNLKDTLFGIGVLVAVIIGGLWYFGAFSLPSAAADNITATPTATVDITAATPTPVPTLEADLLSVSGGSKTALVSPRTLDIAGVSFVVQPVKITSGAWQLPDDPRAVSWVYGTVVNYVFGIEATAESKALLAALQTGDELLLRMSTGPAYRFAVADTVRVAPQASEIFRQNRPGLTLVLVGDETQATRIAIRAVYLPDSELGFAAGSETVADIGTPVSWHDTLQVTVQGSHLVPGHNPPANYRYLAVDAAVKNVTARRLDTSPFQSWLAADGVMYAAAPGLLGKGIDFPPLPAYLRAGTVTTTTMVYAVPETVLRSGADWILAPDSDNDSIRVSLPQLQDWQPHVSFTDAHFTAGTLAVSVTVTAPLDSLTIPAAALKLDGAILGSNNTFPWNIDGGTSANFILNVQPTQNTIRLELMDAGVEITVQ